LVVAYALAGHMDIDLQNDPLGQDSAGNDVYLKDIWPSPQQVRELIREHVTQAMFAAEYGAVFEGDERWQQLDTPSGQLYAWDDASTYVRNPPYFEGMEAQPAPLADIQNARALAKLGDSVTTDHISPAGSIPKDGPAGQYLISKG